jgi:hypothetical protein
MNHLTNDHLVRVLGEIPPTWRDDSLLRVVYTSGSLDAPDFRVAVLTVGEYREIVRIVRAQVVA